MFYRESGDFKTSYAADSAIFPIALDRWFIVLVLAFVLVVVPMFFSEYWLISIFVPVMIMSIAAIGLNILTGYAGQVSLGTGGFMACGAYMAYKISTNLPWMPVVGSVLLAGLCAAMVGIAFGLPSLRIKGFYLAVATLASQFFLLWLFTRVPWFVNNNISGVPSMPTESILGFTVTGSTATPVARYYFVLGFTIFLALIAKNLVRGKIGREWMAIRDMDIAAEIIGIRPLPTKLSAFAISSFFCGVSGALWAFCYIFIVEPEAFSIDRSFIILFMIIVGGLGSILGSFLGAAFIFLLPIVLNAVPSTLGLPISSEMITHIEFMLFGALIVFFLIVEPHGLARLWTIAKEKLRMWPFPH